MRLLWLSSIFPAKNRQAVATSYEFPQQHSACVIMECARLLFGWRR